MLFEVKFFALRLMAFQKLIKDLILTLLPLRKLSLWFKRLFILLGACMEKIVTNTVQASSKQSEPF